MHLETLSGAGPASCLRWGRPCGARVSCARADVRLHWAPGSCHSCHSCAAARRQWARASCHSCLSVRPPVSIGPEPAVTTVTTVRPPLSIGPEPAVTAVTVCRRPSPLGQQPSLSSVPHLCLSTRWIHEQHTPAKLITMTRSSCSVTPRDPAPRRCCSTGRKNSVYCALLCSHEAVCGGRSTLACQIFAAPRQARADGAARTAVYCAAIKSISSPM